MQYNDLLSAANTAIAQRDSLKAAEFLEEALQRKPSSVSALSALAKIYYNQRNWFPAADRAKKWINFGVQEGEFLIACSILCIATRASSGENAARLEYENLKPRMRTMFNSETSGPTENWPLDLALNCAISADNQEFANELFWSGVSESGPWSGCATTISGLTTLREECGAQHTLFRELEKPQRITGSNESISQVSWDYETEGYFLAEIPNAEFLSGWDFVVSSEGNVITDSGSTSPTKSYRWFPHFLVAGIGRVLHPWPEEVIFHDCDALFLSCSRYMHVGHWVVDILPRLRALAEYENLKVAVPTELPAKLRDLLALFRIPDERIIRCDLGRRYRFRKLIVAQVGPETHPSVGNTEFVISALRKSSAAPLHGSRFFFRRGVPTRKIVNQTEVDQVLIELGFEQIDLSAMSIAEQRNRLAVAEIVIATYGSDPEAYFFMPKGSRLIELTWSADVVPLAHAPTCKVLGIKYDIFVGRESDTKIKTMRKDRDFSVDCEDLRKLLNDVA